MFCRFHARTRVRNALDFLIEQSLVALRIDRFRQIDRTRRSRVIAQCLDGTRARLRGWRRRRVSKVDSTFRVYGFYAQRLFMAIVRRFQHQQRRLKENVLDHFVIQLNDDIDSRILLVLQVQRDRLQRCLLRDNILACDSIVSLKPDKPAVMLTAEDFQEFAPIFRRDLECRYALLDLPFF
jgi:hypothetical protein